MVRTAGPSLHSGMISSGVVTQILRRIEIILFRLLPLEHPPTDTLSFSSSCKASLTAALSFHAGIG